ncbi:MAG: beta-galactosidase [Bryobacteraceae bacterium]
MLARWRAGAGARRALGLLALLLFSAAGAAPAGNPRPADPLAGRGPAPLYLQAVEFPYYLYPRALWERELVWLKNIGIRSVEFSIPWNWHQLAPGDFDFTGRTSPRRDLYGFIRILRRLGLNAWVRTDPPVDGWRNLGVPDAADSGARRAWLKQLSDILATQTASHGGPVAWIEGAGLEIDAAAPPAAIRISAGDPAALELSRQALATGKGVLWTGVEDRLYPAGWKSDSGAPLVEGAVGLSGDERPAAAALRREAALLRHWGATIPALQPVAAPQPPSEKLPAGVTAIELVSPGASAVSMINRSGQPFHGDLRVFEPASKRTIAIPAAVPAGEAAWLPLSVSLAPDGLCRECSNFSAAERLVYATAELLSIEYENGILAMEFMAPEDGEAVLQLERKPVGPLLAAGAPVDYDWDEHALRARLPIPHSGAPGHRVRIGIAIEVAETAAFFADARRLIIGQKNAISTNYSSAQVAARSRLRLPEGFTATAKAKSPDEIEYQVEVPADALHGDFATLALEADGTLMGRARLQLFRPFSIRLMEAIQLHFGQHAELTPDPPIAPIDAKAGGNLEISIRNNWPGIQTYRLEAHGDGLEFLPAKTEISIGAAAERSVSLRVFAAEGMAGLRDWHLRVTGAGERDLPMRVLLLPRGRTAVWSADLDGDGAAEWILETERARAVFSAEDGGRWMEFTAKQGNANFLPAAGAYAAHGPVAVRPLEDGLEFTGAGWRRTARLAGGTLTIEQDTPLPAAPVEPVKIGNTALTVEHPSPTRAVYTLQ